MNKLLSLFLTCFFFCYILPVSAHGENEGESTGKSESLLSGALKSIDEGLNDTVQSVEAVVEETVTSTENIVRDTADFTEKTVLNLTTPPEEETVSTILEDTEQLLEKTVEHTLPVVEKATDTVSQATTDVSGIVDEVVEELPTVPIVTPIVNEVREIGGNTTTFAIDTVNQAVDGVVNELPKLPNISPIVEEVQETITPIPAERTEDEATDIPSEKSMDEVVETAEPKKVEQEDEKIGMANKKTLSSIKDKNKSIASPVIEVTADESQGGQVQEELIGLREEESATLPEERESVAKEFLLEDIEHPVPMELDQPEKIDRSLEATMVKGKEVQGPSFPSEPDLNWKSFSIASMTSSTSLTASTHGSTSGNNDVSFGILLEILAISSPTAGYWVRTDVDVLNQWSQAPPGKPPRQSPFLHVNDTL